MLLDLIYSQMPRNEMKRLGHDSERGDHSGRSVAESLSENIPASPCFQLASELCDDIEKNGRSGDDRIYARPEVSHPPIGCSWHRSRQDIREVESI